MVTWLMTSTSLSTSQSASEDPWPAPLPAGNICTHGIMSECTRRGLTGRLVHRSKRHKSGSMEEEVDSPGEYYHSPSPASSSRNWPEDMEGGERTGRVGYLSPEQRLLFLPEFEELQASFVASDDPQEKQLLPNQSQLSTKNNMSCLLITFIQESKEI